ncbi:hypothetical protein NQ176_g8714 [Zarea fungicola]|uniref:Uncharacterized protein n=1 Tax=Zarea fungicola TaxID=93591 RepID=A0ACC1MQQ4_9HYPO|nr:hypothetical protein NQ176_g8714 [Lecanicillium fungicola]
MNHRLSLFLASVVAAIVAIGRGQLLESRDLLEKPEPDTDCRCGGKKVTRRDGELSGGNDSDVNEFPFMCGLADIDAKKIYCGCTIISDQYILTAAHCVQDRDVSSVGIVVGKPDAGTGFNRRADATRFLRLDIFMIHPQYQRYRVSPCYDIAIVRTVAKIEFSAEVGPACLPFQKNQTLFTDSKITALGWGLLEFGGKQPVALQKADFDVISLQECRKSYQTLRNIYITDDAFCTFTPDKDACHFDSGGPLLWRNPDTNNLVVVGITSGGAGCEGRYPSIAMRTGAFLNWIKSVTPDANYCEIE